MPLRRRLRTGRLHLLVDSTGVKLGGAVAWLVEKHGPSQRRSWRKLDIGVEGDSGEIVARELTSRDIDDGSPTGALLGKLTDPLASFTGEGADDQDKVYQAIVVRHPDAAIIVPPRTTAVPSAWAERAATQRDLPLRTLAADGRMSWQKSSGDTLRARGEASIGRYQRVSGDALRSRTNEREATEVAIAAAALNRMLEFGRPKYAPIA